MSFKLFVKKLINDASGVALIEFAYAMPVVLSVGLYGMEAANKANTHLRLSEIVTTVADATSRVRVTVSEDDMDEIFSGAKSIGSAVDFANRGRVIVSSVQPIDNGGSPATQTNNKIRWQRCFGANSANSSYGLQGDNVGLTGIGPTARKISTSMNSEMIYVELVYQYQPMINFFGFGAETINLTRAMTVRDRTTNDIQAGSTTARVCTGTHLAT